MAIATINPATGELLRRFDPLTNQEIERKLQQTAEAFAVNRMHSFAERAGRMHRVAAILEQRQSEYGRLITTEMGKPVKSSIAEVNKCALVCRYYAEHAQSQNPDVEPSLVRRTFPFRALLSRAGDAMCRSKPTS